MHHLANLENFWFSIKNEETKINSNNCNETFTEREREREQFLLFRKEKKKHVERKNFAAILKSTRYPKADLQQFATTKKEKFKQFSQSSFHCLQW